VLIEDLNLGRFADLKTVKKMTRHSKSVGICWQRFGSRDIAILTMPATADGGTKPVKFLAEFTVARINETTPVNWTYPAEIEFPKEAVVRRLG